MKQITPGQTWTLKPPGATDKDLERMIEQYKNVVTGASPFVDEVQFLNKTKHCTIDVVFANKKMVIVFKNPADEIFDLNEIGDIPNAEKSNGETIKKDS